MHLERIDIQRIGYGPDKGEVAGNITVAGESGRLRVTLTPEQAKQVVDLCADALVTCTKEAAQIIKSDLIEHHGATAVMEASK